MNNNGKAFEDLTEAIYRELLRGDPDVEIDRNVRVAAPEGYREVDVLIRTKVGPFSLTTIIECRDRKGAVGIEQIDAFHSKMRDLKASKGVMVSRNGFSRSARQKCARLGIDLYRAGDTLNPDHFAYDMPVGFMVLTIGDISPSWSLQERDLADVSWRTVREVNDVEIVEHLMRDVRAAYESGNYFAGERLWVVPPEVSRPLYGRGISGARIALGESSVKYSLMPTFHFGYLRDFSNVKFLQK